MYPVTACNNVHVRPLSLESQTLLPCFKLQGVGLEFDVNVDLESMNVLVFRPTYNCSINQLLYET